MKNTDLKEAAEILDKAAEEHYAVTFERNGPDSEDSLVVQGAYLSDMASGSVNIYINRGEKKLGTLVETLYPDELVSGTRFGYSFSVSQHGEYIVVGAPGEGIKGRSGKSIGRLYLFKREGETWVKKDKTEDNLDFAGLGHRLSISLEGKNVAASDLTTGEDAVIKIYNFTIEDDKFVLDHVIDFEVPKINRVAIEGIVARTDEALVRTTNGRYFFDLMKGSLIKHLE